MTSDSPKAADHRIARRTGVLWWGAVALVLWAVDQATKAWALSALEWGEPRPFIGNLLKLHLISNPGAAFSLGAGHTWIFTTLSLLVLVFIVVIAFRLRHRGWAIALGLVTAGILGNVTDRLIREPGFAVGHVIDFLQLPNWPIFNVADMCVTGGAIVLILVWFRSGVGPDGLPDAPKKPETKKPETKKPETNESDSKKSTPGAGAHD